MDVLSKQTCHYRKVSKTCNSNVFIGQQNVPCLLKLLINTFNQTFYNITWCSEKFNLLKTKLLTVKVLITSYCVTVGSKKL